MTARVVPLDLLVGRKVRDADGRVVGRIEEVLAERVNQECIVQEYHLGPGALLERLAKGISRIVRGNRHGARVIPWDAVDWSDWERPRLK